MDLGSGIVIFLPMFFMGCCFEILLILRYIKKIHNGDLEDGYNDAISAKEICTETYILY